MAGHLRSKFPLIVSEQSRPSERDTFKPDGAAGREQQIRAATKKHIASEKRQQAPRGAEQRSQRRAGSPALQGAKQETHGRKRQNEAADTIARCLFDMDEE
ncbi:unnamed protein product [Boreogadus saida]